MSQMTKEGASKGTVNLVIFVRGGAFLFALSSSFDGVKLLYSVRISL